MSLFRYEAVDNSGKVFHGAMNARDEQEVAQKLAGMGYTLRAVHTKGGTRPAGTAAVGIASQQSGVSLQPLGTQSAVGASGVPVSVNSIIPARTLAIFFRQLATMVRSGIPLYQSLSDIALYVRDRRLQKVIPHIQQALQSGQSLSGTMAQFPHIFPVHATASIWAGELSGKLEIALDEVAIDFEHEAADTRYGRIGWGITKANVIGIIYIIPLCAFTTLMVGMLNRTPSENIEKLLIFLLVSIAKSTPIALIVIISWMVWGKLKRKPSVRRYLDALLLKTPIWGAIHLYRGQARFLRVLDQLYSAGIGVDTAWNAASLTPRNSALAETLRQTRNEQPHLSDVTNLFSASGMFDMEAVGIIAAGEKSGRIPEALTNVARLCEDIADSRKTIARRTSITLMTVFSLVVYGIAVGIFLYGLLNSFADLIGAAGNV